MAILIGFEHQEYRSVYCANLMDFEHQPLRRTINFMDIFTRISEHIFCKIKWVFMAISLVLSIKNIRVLCLFLYGFSW